MTTASEVPVATRGRFFVYMSWIFLAIAVGGFIPTYWTPLINGNFAGKPVLHVHAIFMLAWVAMYAWQVTLIADRKVQAHRAWGIAGVSVLSIVACTIVLAVINSIQIADGLGMADQARAFSIVSLTGILLIGGLVFLGIRNVSQPDVHKRFMTLSFIPLLEAPMARPFAVMMAPPGAVGPPPLFATVPPSIVVDLLIVALLIYDRRTMGRFHPVTIWGGAAIVAYQVLCLPLGTTSGWASIARFVEGLAG